MKTLRNAMAALCGALSLAACSELPLETKPEPPRQQSMMVGSLSGMVTGPDTTGICSYLAQLNPSHTGAPQVQVFAVNATQQVAVFVSCPSSTYTIQGLQDGMFRLRVRLPTVGWDVGQLPIYSVAGPVSIAGGAAQLNVMIMPGVQVGGNSTLNGAPFPITLNLISPASGLPTNFLMGVLQSNHAPGSVWRDTNTRSPAVLQPGVTYTFFGGGAGLCSALGAKALALPTQFVAAPGVTVNCTLVDSDAAQWTHTGGRIATTSFPGGIGGVNDSRQTLVGSGWGVQFPAPAGPPYSRNMADSELFRGGLILTTSSGAVLTGFNIAGHAQCSSPAGCHDLGINTTTPTSVSGGPGNRVIRWDYSDAGSPEAVGISVVQHSYDGPSNRDYVLFRYAITNNSAVQQTIHAGFFMDWDMGNDLEYLQDVGHTSTDGRIMYITNPVFGTKTVGTFLFGATPVSGNYYRQNNASGALTLAEQLGGLSGALRNPSGSGDMWYLHGAGPITLAPGATRVLWGAVLAGDDQAQLLDNAAAAEADATAREGAHQVQVTVTGSPGVPGVLVTATNTQTGDYVLSLTDHNGVATLLLQDGAYVFHARNLGDAGPTLSQYGGLQLALAPLPEGTGLLNTAATQAVNHASALYSSAGSLPLTPQNYSSLLGSPIVLQGGSGTLSLGIQFQPGATITCNLVDAAGNAIVPTQPENVFVILPVDPSLPMPPVPAPLQGVNLPRGILTAATTVAAGSNACSAAGIAATPAGGAVIETNSVTVNGEEKVFVSTVAVTPQEAANNTTVPTLMVAEPRRSFTHYLNDVFGDNPGTTDLGLVTGGWRMQNGAETDEFVVAARFRGLGIYTLELSYTDAVGMHTYQIPAVCSARVCRLNSGGSALPDGLLTAVEGTNSVLRGTATGTVLWRLSLPGVSAVDIRLFTGQPGRYDTAPDGGAPVRMRRGGSGNTWIIPS